MLNKLMHFKLLFEIIKTVKMVKTVTYFLYISNMYFIIHNTIKSIDVFVH